MKLIIYIIASIYFLASCKYKQQKTSLFVMPKDKWIIYDTTLKKLKSSFENGHIEYFSINNSEFKFYRSENAYVLDVFKKDKWVKNLNLSMPTGEDKFHLSSDIDFDNYFDLTFLEGKNMITYFFDENEGQFNQSPISFPYDFSMLNREKLIYGSNDKTLGTWNIEIFRLQNRRKYYLAKSTIYLLREKNKKDFEITGALEYECKNGNVFDTVLTKKININKESRNFSLHDYMKDLTVTRAYR